MVFASQTARRGRRLRTRGVALSLAAVALMGGSVRVLAMSADDDGGRRGNEAVLEAPVVMPDDEANGFLVGYADVVERGRLAEQGVEPYDSAVHDLLQAAEDALDEEPEPTEPLVIEGTGGPFVRDTGAAYTLALAHAVTGDRRYADHATDIITSWVRSTRTTELTCSDSGSCQTSLVLGRTAPGFVFAVDLLRSAGATGDLDLEAFHRWLESVILPNGSERSNNWGDAGTFMRFVVSLELDDQAGLVSAMAQWRSAMDLVEPDGEIPEESRRGRSGLLYTQGALQYKVAVAWMAERVGVDLWDYRGKRGGTLRAAVDSLAQYLDEPGDWPWHDRKVRVPTPSPMWELVAAHWPEPEFQAIAADGRPFGADDDSAVEWTTLAVAAR